MVEGPGWTPEGEEPADEELMRKFSGFLDKLNPGQIQAEIRGSMDRTRREIASVNVYRTASEIFAASYASAPEVLTSQDIEHMINRSLELAVKLYERAQAHFFPQEGPHA